MNLPDDLNVALSELFTGAARDRLYPERVFRLINDTDIVPHLPPLPEFHRAGRELNFDTAGALRSEIGRLGRLLGYAANGVKSIRNASRKAVDDHGMDYYVARCAALTKTVQRVS